MIEVRRFVLEPFSCIYIYNFSIFMNLSHVIHHILVWGVSQLFIPSGIIFFLK